MTSEEPKAQFDQKAAKFMITCSMYQHAENKTWRPDLSSLTIFCGTDAVACCKFNLIDFIDKEPKYQTVNIIQESEA